MHHCLQKGRAMRSCRERPMCCLHDVCDWAPSSSARKGHRRVADWSLLTLEWTRRDCELGLCPCFPIRTSRLAGGDTSLGGDTGDAPRGMRATNALYEKRLASSMSLPRAQNSAINQPQLYTPARAKPHECPLLPLRRLTRIARRARRGTPCFAQLK